MQAIPTIRRTGALVSSGLGLLLSLATNANASLVFTFTVSPASISTGANAILDLHVVGSPEPLIGATASFINGADLTFTSGEGQSFHLLIPASGGTRDTAGLDFQHQFTYLSPGVFSPGVSGSLNEEEPDAADVFTATRLVDLTSSLTVNSVAAAAPEPSTWAMMILGFAGIGWLTYRRRSARLPMKLSSERLSKRLYL